MRNGNLTPASQPLSWKAALWTIVGLVVVVWAALGSDSSDDLSDWSTCIEMAGYAGTNYETAMCTENGELIKYKDSEIGQRIGQMSGQ